MAGIVGNLARGCAFAGRATLRKFSIRAAGEFAYAVAVPVRNESAILPGMLAALLPTLKGVSELGLAVFAVNDTQGSSAQLIWDRRRLRQAQHLRKRAA